MPSKRRGGFNPPELRGTLGTLLRTTTGVVRDALERGAREGRARLDDARANRRRHDALADLGEIVLDLIRRGEIDLAELPEARDLVRQLDDLDAEPADEPPPPPPRGAARRRFDDRPTTRFDDRRAGSDAPSARSPDRPGRPAERPARSEGAPGRAADRAGRSEGTSGRFDDRDDDRPDDPAADRSHDRAAGRAADRPSGRPADRDDDSADDRAAGRAHDRAPGASNSSPVVSAASARGRDSSAHGPASAVAAAAAAIDSDGTVSSGIGDRTMRPTLPARPRHNDPASARAAPKPIKGLWRDRFEDEPAPSRAPAARGATVTAPPDTVPTEKPPFLRPPTPLDPGRKGGISFDDDLEDYMHPDDVPPKPPAPPADPDDGDA